MQRGYLRCSWLKLEGQTRANARVRVRTRTWLGVVAYDGSATFGERKELSSVKRREAARTWQDRIFRHLFGTNDRRVTCASAFTQS